MAGFAVAVTTDSTTSRASRKTAASRLTYSSSVKPTLMSPARGSRRDTRWCQGWRSGNLLTALVAPPITSDTNTSNTAETTPTSQVLTGRVSHGPAFKLRLLKQPVPFRPRSAVAYDCRTAHFDSVFQEEEDDRRPRPFPDRVPRHSRMSHVGIERSRADTARAIV